MGTVMRVFLSIVALIFIVFGVIYMFAPENFATAAGLRPTPSGLTDVRATYGGFQIGFALFLIWSCRSERRYANALLGCALITGFVAIGRIYGLAVDRELSNFHYVGLCFEIPISALSLWLFQKAVAKPA
ncbi:MAG: DUF4345 domain-containing protein [Pseudomonadota bacterium]